MATSPRSDRRRCEFCGASEGEKHSPTCGFLEEIIDTERRIDAGQIVVQLPGEVMPYRVELQRFIDAMVYKLKVHSKKGKWENMSSRTAYELLQGEVAELEEAIRSGNMVETLLESADVANFALIISAIAVEKK